MQPSDFPASFGRSFGSPCWRPTSMQELVLSRTAHAPADARRVGDGSPALRNTGFSRGEARTSQVPGPSSSCAPWSNTPPDTTPPCPYSSSRRNHGEVVVAFRENRTLGIRDDIAFEAAVPRLTRSRAYASPISLPGPAPGSLPARAGSPLAGRDSHPLDDKRSFMESSQPSIPLRPAEPGRTDFSIPTGAARSRSRSRARAAQAASARSEAKPRAGGTGPLPGRHPQG